MTGAEAVEHIYMQYQRAKMTWRRFTEKPIRKFRRAIRHAKGKRQHGKKRGFFFTHDDVMVYLEGKGTCNRSNTSGKGHGGKAPETDEEASRLVASARAKITLPSIACKKKVTVN